MFLKAVVVVLVLLVASNYYDNLMGTNLHFKKHYPGKCKLVKGHERCGSEDLQVTSEGLAFITSGVNMVTMSSGFKDFYKTKKCSGKIYLYDFNKPEMGSRVLKIKPSKSFNPDTFRANGISILEDKVNGQHLLYVVNHPDSEDDSVEKFRYQPETNELVHLKTFRDSTFTTLNDLALTGEDTFYITNFFYGRSHFMEQVEVFFKLSLGSVVYFNGTGARYATGGLYGPNGISLSKDKKFAYVNFPYSKTMQVYKRNGDDSLELVQDLPLHALPDNFHLTAKGDALLTGAHPIGHKIAAHLENPSLETPSSVLYLPLRDGLVVEDGIIELFYDHGDLISGSTIAAMHGDQLLIGSIIDSLVVCDVKVDI